MVHFDRPDAAEVRAVLPDLVLALCRRSLTASGPLQVLDDAALALARALGVRGAVLLVPGPGWVAGSDATAALLGDVQQRAGQGPLVTALRSPRPVLTADLTRIGPPALAALAAESALASSAAVALSCDGVVVAALQLVGGPDRPVGPPDLDALAGSITVLGARIADLREVATLRRRESAAVVPAQSTPPPVEFAVATTTALTTVTPRVATIAQPLLTAPPELATDQLRAVVPAARPGSNRG